jgi:hypothetical protein
MGVLVCWIGVVSVLIVALIFVLAIPIVIAGGQNVILLATRT